MSARLELPILRVTRRKACGNGKKCGNRPPFFGRIPTCTIKRQGGCRVVNDTIIASKAKAQLPGFMGKVFTHFSKQGRRFMEDCICGTQASGDAKLSSIVRAPDDDIMPIYTEKRLSRNLDGDAIIKTP